MNDKKLIQLVRGYSVLYDVSHAKYMDSDYKNAVWRKIGADMQTDASLCKTRWSNIRDNFRKSLNKQKTKINKRGSKVKLYKYSEQLNFLKQFFEEKIPRTNTTEVIKANFTVDMDIEEPENYDSTTEVNDPVAIYDKSTDNILPPPPRKIRLSAPTQTPPKTAPATATVMECFVEKDKNIDCPPPAQHPVDSFLAGMAPVLKKLSQREWHFARGEIFATVQKYEFNLLMNQQPQQKRSVEPHTASMCSTEQLSPAGSYISTLWDDQQSTIKTEDNAVTDLIL